jgi:hypothetical protein
MAAMHREYPNHSAQSRNGSREAVARRIREMSSLDVATAATVVAITGHDPASARYAINGSLALVEGRHGGQAWASIVETVTDGEARSLYGEGFGIRLPVSGARHPDRDCAVALAILSLPTWEGVHISLAAA